MQSIQRDWRWMGANENHAVMHENHTVHRVANGYCAREPSMQSLPSSPEHHPSILSKCPSVQANESESPIKNSRNVCKIKLVILLDAASVFLCDGARGLAVQVRIPVSSPPSRSIMCCDNIRSGGKLTFWWQCLRALKRPPPIPVPQQTHRCRH